MTTLLCLALLAAAADPAAVRMHDRRATPAERNEACRRLAGAGAIPYLEEGLQDPVVRGCAATRLRELGAVEALIRALGSPSPEISARAAYELGAAKDRRAIEPLMAAARQSDPLGSASALQALLGFEDPRVLKVLMELASRQGISSLAVIHSLSRFRDPAAAETLHNLLAARDPLLRIAAISALGEVGAAGTIPKLQPLLREVEELHPSTGLGFYPSINVARAARVAIERIRNRETSDEPR